MMNSVGSCCQLTLAILKPHITKVPHVFQSVRYCIVDNGFQVVKSLKTTITRHQAEDFYFEHKGRFFYNRLLTFMCSGPSDIYILAKPNAVKNWRLLMGPTKVYQAIFTAPDSIRGSYGLTDTRNATHGSDSLESAAREIAIFFPDFDIHKWMTEQEPLFRRGLTQFDKKKFVHLPELIS